MSQSIIQQLLQIEAEHRLWDTEVDGMHLWPLIRHQVLEQVLWPDFSKKNTTRTYYDPHLLATHLNTLPLLFQRSQRLRYDRLIFKSSITRNGDYDRLYQPYIDTLANPLVFETLSTGESRRIQPAFHYSDNTLRVVATLLSTRYWLGSATKGTIQDFARFVTIIFGLSPEKSARFASLMMRRVRQFAALLDVFGKVIRDQIKSPWVLSHHAASLGYSAIRTRALHEMGFKVAEVQHGAIHPLHYDYKYPQKIIGNPQHISKIYLPDELLTFGTFWSDLVTAPFETRVIGYPHITKQAARWQQNTQTKETQLLVISQSTLSAEIATLTEHIARACPELGVVLKLHPQHESPDHVVFQTVSRLKNVQIIQNADVYQLIAGSGTVIGYYSTVLYEALAFPGKRVFIAKNARVPEGICPTFSSIDELVDLLKQTTTTNPQKTSDQIWQPDGEVRIQAFLEETR